MAELGDRPGLGETSNRAEFGIPERVAAPDNGPDETARIVQIAGGAFARLKHDLDTYHPNKPALVYALAGETHEAIMQQWRLYPAGMQTALLTALLAEVSTLLQELQMRGARIGPANGFMYGLQDEAIRLETLADITVEEMNRIEGELRGLQVERAYN